MKKVALVAAAVALCVAGQAQAIDVDFTGYTIGTIDGQSGHTASGGVDAVPYDHDDDPNTPDVAAWEKWQYDTVDIVDDNLGTAGSETSANPIVSVDTPGAWYSNWARLEVDGVSDDGWWLAGIVQYDGEFETENGNGGRMCWFGVQLYRGDTEVFGLGKGGSDDTYATFGDASATSAVPVVAGESALLVANYDGSSVKMWVNPDLTSETPPVADAEDTNPGDLTGIDHLYVRSGSGELEGGPAPTAEPLQADNIYLGNDSPFGALVILDGDFNGDGAVDGNDFLIWQNSFPTAGGATLAMGDADGNGTVDGNDFLIWQNNYPTAGSTSEPAAVPEPTSLALLGLAGVAVLRRRRRSC